MSTVTRRNMVFISLLCVMELNPYVYSLQAVTWFLSFCCVLWDPYVFFDVLWDPYVYSLEGVTRFLFFLAEWRKHGFYLSVVCYGTHMSTAYKA